MDGAARGGARGGGGGEHGGEAAGDKWLFVALKQDGHDAAELEAVLRKEFVEVCKAVRPEVFENVRFSKEEICARPPKEPRAESETAPAAAGGAGRVSGNGPGLGDTEAAADRLAGGDVDGAGSSGGRRPGQISTWRDFIAVAQAEGFYFRERCTWNMFARSGDHDQFTAIVFAGHATKRGKVKFGKDVSPDAPVLANMLAEIEALRLLILNCCTTEPLATEVIRKRADQRFYVKGKHDVVVFCWSTECSFDGAMYMNKHFCREVRINLSRHCPSNRFLSDTSLSPELKASAFRSAFQSAVEQTAANPIQGERHIPGHNGNEGGSDLLGEPMLLPYLSTNDSYLYGMIAKYKVADTGIELMKRLKTTAKIGFLFKERHKTNECRYGYRPCNDHCSAYNAKVTTLYQFGEFFGWLQLMRKEDTEYYRNPVVAEVIFAFCGEYKHLRDDTSPRESEPGLLLKIKDQLGDFATTVSPGCFSLYPVQIQDIAEVMLDPRNPRSVLRYIDFHDMWAQGQRLRHGQQLDNPVAAAQAARLMGVFAKLEADIDVLALDISHDAPPVSGLGALLARVFPWLANSRRLPFRMPFLGGNPIYEPDPLRIRRDANVYRRIAWIHDSILRLVSMLDPGMQRDIKDDTLFHTFTEVDSHMYPSRTQQWSSFIASTSSVMLGGAAVALLATSLAQVLLGSQRR